MHHNELIIQHTLEIIRHEMSNLNSCKDLRIKPSEFNPILLVTFSFNEIYQKMQQCAPNVILLLESLMSGDSAALHTSSLDSESEDNDEIPDTSASAQIRKIVIALSILLSAGSLNFVHSFFSYYLYASRMEVRIIIILNHIGISMSRSHVGRILEQQANQIRQTLRRLSFLGIAFQISFDNINWLNDIRYERLHNQNNFASAITGFILIPNLKLRHPMFTHSDIRSENVQQLIILDFLPSDKDDDILSKSFRYSIFSILKSFAKVLDLKLPSLNIDHPDVTSLDPNLKPEIYIFPLLDLDES